MSGRPDADFENFFTQRSGGMGGGNLPIPKYRLPDAVRLKIIKSDVSGISISPNTSDPKDTEIKPLEVVTLPVTAPAGVPPETKTGLE